jgi:hypothetical protein
VNDLLIYQHRFRKMDFVNILTKSNFDVATQILKNSILPTDSNLMDKYVIYSNYIEPFLKH